MTKRIVTIIVFCFYSIISNAFNLQWSRNIGAPLYSADAIQVYEKGFVYITGQFNGIVDFDPSTNVYSLDANYGHIYIAKFDTSGNFIWAKNFGGQGKASSLDIDKMENIIIAGVDTLTADFNPNMGTFNLNSNGKNDFFILKLDSNGNFIWAENIGGADEDYCTAITSDTLGNLYCSGSYKGPVDFDASSNSFNSVDTGGYILKLDINGLFQWVKFIIPDIWSIDPQFNPTNIRVDIQGNIHSCGVTNNGRFDWDPGPLDNYIFNGANYSQDFYFLELDVNGDFVYVYKNNSGNSQNPHIYYGKDFIYAVQYKNSFWSPNIPSVSSYPAINCLVIAKLDYHYNAKWVKALINAVPGQNPYGNEMRSFAITADEKNNIYVSSWAMNIWYNGATVMDMDPGPGMKLMPTNQGPNGGGHLFILKLDSIGYYASCMVYNSSLYNSIVGNGIGVDKSDGLYVKNQNILNKYNFCHVNKFIEYSNCDSVTYNNIVYYHDTILTSYYTTSSGCDSNVFTKIKVNLPINDTLYLNVCDSITIANQFIDSSGVYNFHYNSSVGCDSTVNIFLTIHHPVFDTITIVACDSITINNTSYNTSGTYNQLYSQFGCDSTVTMYLTINLSSASTTNASVCSNQLPYIWNGQSINTSGAYTYQTTNSAGCDSIAILNLTINQAPQTNIIQNNYILYTPFIANIYYQWSLNGAVLSNIDSITITQNGTYIVIITDSFGCIGVDSFTVSALALDNYSDNNSFTIYPNPTDNKLTIDYDLEKTSIVNIRLLDMTGKVISNITANENQSKGNHKKVINLKSLSISEGMYMLQLSDGVSKWNQRILFNE